MRIRTVRMVCGVAAGAVLLGLLAQDVHAARAAKGERPGGEADGGASAANDFAAMQMLQRGKDMLAAGEKERGMRMLETVVQQFPTSKVRYFAYIALGKYLLDAYELDQAIPYLTRVKELEQEKDLTPEYKDILVESLYLTGVAYYQKREYNRAFPALRKVTMEYPNTVWANQAYFYIGMCHFVQENWNKAIESLSLVGTYVDPASPTVHFVEAGRRFYVKVEDADLPIMVRLGFQPVVVVETKSGDKERLSMVSISSESPVFVGSVPTDVGSAVPGDNILQIIGGDEITATYIDGNTESGEKDVPRRQVVKVVSTGGAFISMGDYETRAKLAFIDQPVCIVLLDADLDISPHADEAKVKVVSRYRVEDAEEEAPVESSKGGFADLLVQKKKDNYRVRDEVVVALKEVGTNEPVHTGRFNGKVVTIAGEGGRAADKTDDKLECMADDEIVVTYIDELHSEGTTPRECISKVTVAGVLDSSVKVTQPYTSDEMVKAKKNLVEGQAYLELARIFKDMGLQKGANAKAAEGLERADSVILTQAAIDPNLREQAFKLKWELHIVQNDLSAAIATCQSFNKLFPNSPFVDQALKGIADVKEKQGDLQGAVAVYQQILGLQNSLAKAEAQYRIADCTEQMAAGATTAGGNPLEKAIPLYKIVADRYPDSPFAGPALGKIIDYHVESKDYAAANQMLEQVFQDYPDEQFLDAMLMKWVLVAYRMGDFKKSHEKCSELLFQYPDSSYAGKAREMLPKIEAKLQQPN